MRRLISTVLVLLWTGAYAQAQIGPPQPRAVARGYSLGVGLHNVNRMWVPYDVEVARNRFYLELSHGLNDGLEIFGRMGGSNLVINEVATYRKDLDHDVSSQGYPAFFSGGLRGRPWASGPWSIGASLEAALYSSLEKTIRWKHDVYQELSFGPMLELNGGLTLGRYLGDGVVYGGPLIHFGYARADVRTHKFGKNWEIEDSIAELTVRDKAGFGGLLGWQMPIGRYRWKLQLELTAVRGGFGGAISFFNRS